MANKAATDNPAVPTGQTEQAAGVQNDTNGDEMSRGRDGVGSCWARLKLKCTCWGANPTKCIGTITYLLAQLIVTALTWAHYTYEVTKDESLMTKSYEKAALSFCILRSIMAVCCLLYFAASFIWGYADGKDCIAHLIMSVLANGALLDIPQLGLTSAWCHSVGASPLTVATIASITIFGGFGLFVCSGMALCSYGLVLISASEIEKHHITVAAMISLITQIVLGLYGTVLLWIWYSDLDHDHVTFSDGSTMQSFENRLLELCIYFTIGCIGRVVFMALWGSQDNASDGEKYRLYNVAVQLVCFAAADMPLLVLFCKFFSAKPSKEISMLSYATAVAIFVDILHAFNATFLEAVISTSPQVVRAGPWLLLRYLRKAYWLIITVVVAVCAWWLALTEIQQAEVALEAGGVHYDLYQALAMFAAATETVGLVLLFLGGLRRLAGCHKISTARYGTAATKWDDLEEMWMFIDGLLWPLADIVLFVLGIILYATLAQHAPDTGAGWATTNATAARNSMIKAGIAELAPVAERRFSGALFATSDDGSGSGDFSSLATTSASTTPLTEAIICVCNSTKTEQSSGLIAEDAGTSTPKIFALIIFSAIRVVFVPACACWLSFSCSDNAISTRGNDRLGVRRAITSTLVYLGALLHAATPVACLALYVNVIEAGREGNNAAGTALATFAILRGLLTIVSYGIWGAARCAKLPACASSNILHLPLCAQFLESCGAWAAVIMSSTAVVTDIPIMILLSNFASSGVESSSAIVWVKFVLCLTVLGFLAAFALSARVIKHFGSHNLPHWLRGSHCSPDTEGSV